MPIFQESNHNMLFNDLMVEYKHIINFVECKYIIKCKLVNLLIKCKYIKYSILWFEFICNNYGWLYKWAC